MVARFFTLAGQPCAASAACLIGLVVWSEAARWWDVSWRLHCAMLQLAGRQPGLRQPAASAGGIAPGVQHASAVTNSLVGFDLHHKEYVRHAR